MNFNFELILFYGVIISGIIYLADVLFLEKKRQQAHVKKMPLIVDYARSFFPVLLLVFLLRSFLYEPFRIPSGSLKPTLNIGDFILVNKFNYGIRLPVIHKKLYALAEPQRGDIIVFRWPPNPSIDFIKRVIGVPGDHISYLNKTLYINGKKASQQFVKNTTDQDESGMTVDVVEKKENLLGLTHAIYQVREHPNDEVKDVVVPPGMYFVMGDNRDNSADSRYWGFVPEQNIVGKAMLVWMSWDGIKYNVRWNRIGKFII
ncbi:MAG: lepB [Gammaproteobacteria bacterium]|jgi:signal peptidase I|nr:lepB [Gammaproteobacteria bacterium]